MNVEAIKKELYSHLGDTVSIKYNLGRNKYEEYDAVIKKIYNHVFLVQLSDENANETKSFSYSDIITKTIKINYQI